MSDTPNFGLPLVAPSQAQKHVTVNEALARLDALGQLVIAARDLTTPPVAVLEGVVYAVPPGAVNEWAANAGDLAVFVNGGWAFVTPRAGWRAWISAEGVLALHDGAEWIGGGLALSPGGAHTRFEVIEVDEVLVAGASVTTSLVIPQYGLVQGITGRILSSVTGTLTGWQLGVGGAPDRYASGLGLAAGSWIVGASGTPLTYYSNTPVVLTAQGGDFAGGEVRLAVHVQRIAPPAAV